MKTYYVKQGEVIPVEIQVLLNGAIIDVSTATLTLVFKRSKADTTKTIEKLDASFDKAGAAQGIVSVVLDANDTNQTPGSYVGELKAVFPDGTEDKSEDVYLEVEASVD